MYLLYKLSYNVSCSCWMNTNWFFSAFFVWHAEHGFYQLITSPSPSYIQLWEFQSTPCHKWFSLERRFASLAGLYLKEMYHWCISGTTWERNWLAQKRRILWGIDSSLVPSPYPLTWSGEQSQTRAFVTSVRVLSSGEEKGGKLSPQTLGFPSPQLKIWRPSKNCTKKGSRCDCAPWRT